ncbi:MAG: serine hydrolase domain-containing protein [Actinomycetota bacterium]
MNSLNVVATWPVTTVAAGWRGPDDGPTSIGPVDQVFPLASVTKPLVAFAVLVAVEEGSLALDQPAGPPGSTVANLLSHSAGLGPDAPPAGAEPGPLTPVGSRRIYSNHGFEELGRALEATTGFTCAQYLDEAVCAPLGMTGTELRGSPAHGAVSTVSDLLRFGAELLRPTLLSAETVAAATTPHLPELAGVLPGFGRQDPNPWGLGFEIRGTKSPHWTGSTNDPATFGHFGRSGTFLWVDRSIPACCVVLTDRDFGPWAAEAWPPLADAVVADARSA